MSKVTISPLSNRTLDLTSSGHIPPDDPQSKPSFLKGFSQIIFSHSNWKKKKTLIYLSKPDGIPKTELKPKQPGGVEGLRVLANQDFKTW